MTKKIVIGTGTLADASKEFVEAWRQTEQGHISKAPVEKITFKDQRMLFKTLTPKRFEILKSVHQKKAGVSIRALSKELDRDYSNVYQDVKILFQLGLMLKHENNVKYYVPWDMIVTEIPLTSKPDIKETAHPSTNKARRVGHG